LFFVVLGSVIAFVSLRNPHDEPFDIRMNILFGKKLNEEPVATQYLQNEIRRLGYIVKDVNRSLTIEKYDSSLEAYLVRFENLYYMYNLFDSINVRTELEFQYTPDELAKEPERYGAIISIEIEKFKNEKSVERQEVVKNAAITKNAYKPRAVDIIIEEKAHDSPHFVLDPCGPGVQKGESFSILHRDRSWRQWWCLRCGTRKSSGISAVCSVRACT